MVHICDRMLVMKRKEMEPLVEMWMDLESVIQSKVRKRKTNVVY